MTAVAAGLCAVAVGRARRPAGWRRGWAAGRARAAGSEALLVTASALGAFVAVTADVYGGANTVQYFDGVVHTWVVSHFSPEQRSDANALSNLVDNGVQLASWGLAAVLLLYRRSAAAAAVPVGLEVVKEFCRTIKHDAHRIRPSDIVPDFSFPSSHTARFALCATLALCVLWPRLRSRGVTDIGDDSEDARLARWTVAFFAAWSAMGSLRVLADAHWVSDTLGGAALGLCVAAAAEITLTWAGSIQTR